MRLKHFLYTLLMLPLLWSCNNEDDVEEIFASGTWYVLNYYTKADWDQPGKGEPRYKPDSKEGIAALEVISKFALTFKDDGTFDGSMQNSTFSGTWEADGKNQTVYLTLKGKPNTSTAYNKEFIEFLQNVVFYQGDSKNYLILGPEDKRSFIQFRHN